MCGQAMSADSAPTADAEEAAPVEDVVGSTTAGSNSVTPPKSPDTETAAFKGDVVRISVKSALTNAGKFETRMEGAVLSKGHVLTPLQAHYRLCSWTRAEDSALLEYLNNKVHQRSLVSLALDQPFAIAKPYLLYQGECLAHFSVLDIMMRAQLIAGFNKNLEALLPLIDLSNDDPRSLGAVIRKSNRYMLSKVKMPLLENAITATAAAGGTDIPASFSLDNFKALASRDRLEQDPATSQNTFVQCFRALQHKDSAVFRHVFSGDRVFQITFTDESGIDAGGVFREGMSRIMEDLFSAHFNLLLLCSNGQQAVHASIDKYIPNPKHTGPLALEMFNFLGRLMAMSVRVKLCLPFEFPPLIWKKIVGEEVTASDLIEVDIIAAKQLDTLERCDELPSDDPVIDEDTFQAKFSAESGKLMFVFMGSDHTERELMRGGAHKEVTFANRLEYCQAVRAARLAEFDVQTAAIAKGMAEVVPMRELLLFSASQVEELVCGSPQIDMELWKANTESSGVPAATVELFWKVMELLTPKEQSGFVRFAWGRSRLPARKEDFTTKMKLTNAGRAALPVSHTCFFSIELPEYRTEEEMRHGLLTVIHFGVGGILNG